MSAFAELQRELLDSVSARVAPPRAAAVKGRARWLRARLSRGAPLVAIAILVALIAFPAMRMSTITPSPRPAALAGVGGAERAEGPCRVCQAVGGRLHASPSGEVTSTRLTREVHVRDGLPVMIWAATVPQ